MAGLANMFIVAAVLTLPHMRAQRAPSVPTGSFVRPAAAASSGTFRASSVVMIENRARTLGNRTSANGTRYFAVTDSDLIGQKPDEILRRLSPQEVSARDCVRAIEILVDLHRPITLFSSPTNPVNIGTAVVHGAGQKEIDVRATIFASEIKIVRK